MRIRNYSKKYFITEADMIRYDEIAKSPERKEWLAISAKSNGYHGYRYMTWYGKSDYIKDVNRCNADTSGEIREHAKKVLENSNVISTSDIDTSCIDVMARVVLKNTESGYHYIFYVADGNHMASSTSLYPNDIDSPYTKALLLRNIGEVVTFRKDRVATNYKIMNFGYPWPTNKVANSTTAEPGSGRDTEALSCNPDNKASIPLPKESDHSLASDSQKQETNEDFNKTNTVLGRVIRFISKFNPFRAKGQ